MHSYNVAIDTDTFIGGGKHGVNRPPHIIWNCKTTCPILNQYRTLFVQYFEPTSADSADRVQSGPLKVCLSL